MYIKFELDICVNSIFLPQAFVFVGHVTCYHSNYEVMIALTCSDECLLECTCFIPNFMAVASIVSKLKQ